VLRCIPGTTDARIWVYLPWAFRLERALKKMPTTIRNKQMGTRLDKTQERDVMFDITSRPLYRKDLWCSGDGKGSEYFEKQFLETWAPGAPITNPGFLSVMTVPNSYHPTKPGVDRTLRLKDPKAGASIIDLSLHRKENEVLLQRNVTMKILKITRRGVPGEAEAKTITSPKADYEHHTELRPHFFDVDVEVEGGSPGEQTQGASAPAADTDATRGAAPAAEAHGSDPAEELQKIRAHVPPFQS
jgi:hypothetical protein